MRSQQGEQFDLILMDIDMPVMDGYTRNQGGYGPGEDSRRASLATPIVALSADAMQRSRARQPGCRMRGARRQAGGPGNAAQDHPPLCEGPGARVPFRPRPRRCPSKYRRWFLSIWRPSTSRSKTRASPCWSRDFGPIRRFGHDLKGTGRGYGFPAIEELGQQIEKAAGEADVDRIAGQLNALHRYVTESGAAATAATDSVREAR